MNFDVLSEYYFIIKALHLIFVISWMAGIFYLPRLFVYHTTVESSSEAAQKFIIMEQRLVKIIMNPAMIGTFVMGILLICVPGMLEPPVGWLHLKILLVLTMAGLQGFFIRCMKQLRQGIYPYASNTFRYFNEIPPLLMMIIIFLVVLKPF